MNEEMEEIEMKPEKNGAKIIKEMLRKERKQFRSHESNDVIIDNIPEEINNDDNESDIDEKEFTKISIHNEKFVYILDNLFLILISYGFLLLFVIIIAGIYNYNVFPFEIQDLSNWATQIGYVIFFASYWTTNVILLRAMTILGYVFFIMAGFLANPIPSMDVLSWTGVFMLINIQQILRLLYDARPIVFDPYREKIYTNMFEGIMKRSDFKTLTKNSLLRDLDKTRFYAKVGDRCSSLSILVYGTMKVYSGNNIIDEDEMENVNLYDNASSQTEIHINEDEFIDSSQWMLRNNTKNRNKGKRFTQSIKAITPCKYLTWPREMLQELLHKHPELDQPLLGALGLDVSHKVLLQSG